MATMRLRLDLLATLTITGLALGWSAPAQAGASQDSACAVFLARPDLRGCVAYPECGGYFIYEYNRPVKDLCTADLPFAGYVSRLVYVDDDGTITRFGAPCDEPLTGSIQPDPDYPDFNMFVYLGCVG